MALSISVYVSCIVRKFLLLWNMNLVQMTAAISISP